jgi:hypothetical protein
MSAFSRYWPWVAGSVVLIALVGAAVSAGRFFRPTGKEQPPSVRPPEDPPDIAEQVHNFCGAACHAYPPPDTFPRKHWRAEVEQGFRFFGQSSLALKQPPSESVVRYYESRAPEELPLLRFDPPTRPLGVSFERRGYPGPEVRESFAISNVNLVHLPDPSKPRPAGKQPLDVLACDMRNGLVMLLRPYEEKPVWKVLARLPVLKPDKPEERSDPHPARTFVIDLDGDGINDVIVANLGNFPPTDRRCGSVVWLRGQPDGSFTPITLLDNVGRVADVRAADFSGTGKLDLVVAVFGWHATGEILHLENKTTAWNKPKFVRHVLDSRPGTIHVPVADLNGDGKPDFVALISQEHETIVAFLNDGAGKFTKKTLYSAPHPGYGSSGIQLTDLNGDGKLDVLYTNGDVLDEPYLFKPYHGVQWLENKGNLKFEHHPIAPMYGTHRAVAADLSGTGRKDIVAVSFLPVAGFPDRKKLQADALIVLEQVAPGKFERHALEKVECDHVTCAVGDVYGTGRMDIVVGNYSSATTKDPVTIWKNLGPRRPLP